MQSELRSTGHLAEEAEACDQAHQSKSKQEAVPHWKGAMAQDQQSERSDAGQVRAVGGSARHHRRHRRRTAIDSS